MFTGPPPASGGVVARRAGTRRPPPAAPHTDPQSPTTVGAARADRGARPTTRPSRTARTPPTPDRTTLATSNAPQLQRSPSAHRARAHAASRTSPAPCLKEAKNSGCERNGSPPTASGAGCNRPTCSTPDGAQTRPSRLNPPASIDVRYVTLTHNPKLAGSNPRPVLGIRWNRGL